MSDSLVVGTRRDGKITITDGAASSYEVSFEVGAVFRVRSNAVS